MPLSGTSAPYAMDRDTVRTRGRQDVPTDATAVFPTDSVPAFHSGSTLKQSAYRLATVQYLNVSGERVNLAEPGGRIGNVVRELSAGEPGDRRRVGNRPSTERAELLSTRSVYDQTVPASWRSSDPSAGSTWPRT